jgi:hypothetical protein
LNEEINHPMKLLSILLFLTACTSISASAKWGPLPLKSLVEHSNCIVVAEFVSEETKNISPEGIDQLSTLKVTSIIKGESPEEIIVFGFINKMVCKPQFVFPATKGTKYLLFLQKSNDKYSVLNGNFGALTITDNKVKWFTDETQTENLNQRKPTELDAAIKAIKAAESPVLPEAQEKD